MVVLRPQINPGLNSYWDPWYLPGNSPNALAFLHTRLAQLTPYLAIAGRSGAGTDLVATGVAALGVAALARMGRLALAGLLPATLAVAVVASAVRVYPFGDERISTFWLVMVPVLMAIGVAAVIHVVAFGEIAPGPTRSPGRARARWAAALAATALAVTALSVANSRWVDVRSIAINPQNPYDQIVYVEKHFRRGDVILVNEEATYAFAYYYKTPPQAYTATTVTANGFSPAYPNEPWIIALTNRDQATIADGVAQAVDVLAAQQPAHRGRIWVITDHLTTVELASWDNALAGGRLITIRFRRFQARVPESLLLFRPAVHAAAPAALWGSSADRWQRMLSLATPWPAAVGTA